MTDDVTFAYITDVYVLKAYQGKSLGRWMLACLDEALRLYPPVPSMLQRKTLPGAPTMIAGHMVPENVSCAAFQA